MTFRVSAVDEAGADAMNYPLIPAQIINLVAPSISLTLNNFFNTGAETTMSEFDLHIDYFPNVFDSAEKNGTVNHASATTLHHDRENNAIARLTKKNKFILTPE